VSGQTVQRGRRRSIGLAARCAVRRQRPFGSAFSVRPPGSRCIWVRFQAPWSMADECAFQDHATDLLRCRMGAGDHCTFSLSTESRGPLNAASFNVKTPARGPTRSIGPCAECRDQHSTDLHTNWMSRYRARDCGASVDKVHGPERPEVCDAARKSGG